MAQSLPQPQPGPATGGPGARPQATPESRTRNLLQIVRGTLGFLAWNPGNAWRWDATLFAADFDNGYDEFALDNNGERTFSDQPGRDEQRSLAASHSTPAASRTKASSENAIESVMLVR